MNRLAMLMTISTLVLLPACARTSSSQELLCKGKDDVLILTAQMVPSATMIPCVAGYPTGWTPGGFQAKTGRVTFWMNSDRAGAHAVELELSERCDTSNTTGVETGPDPGGVLRLDQRITAGPRLSGRRLFVFEGGCVTLRYGFEGGAQADLLEEVAASLVLAPRGALVTALREKRDLVLCGAGAPPCP